MDIAAQGSLTSACVNPQGLVLAPEVPDAETSQSLLPTDPAIDTFTQAPLEAAGRRQNISGSGDAPGDIGGNAAGGAGGGGRRRAAMKPAAAEDAGGGESLASMHDGAFGHGTHLVDLLLDIKPGTESSTLPAFDRFISFIGQLINQIDAGEMRLNEKFDGSPAILLGIDGDGKPFVAFKYAISGKREPRLVRSAAEAHEVFRGSDLAKIYEDCIRCMGPRIGEFGRDGFVFQADVLFTQSNNAREVMEDEVRIHANESGLTYVIKPDSEYFKAAAEAKVGLVVHTIARRVIDEETGGITGLKTMHDETLVREFTRALRSSDVFAIDPWSYGVKIDRDEGRTLSARKKGMIERMIEDMRSDLSDLSPEFRTEWSKTFQAQFSIFLNDCLKAGGTGGIYKAAAAGKPFDFDLLVNAFQAWYEPRSRHLSINQKGEKGWASPKRMPEKFPEFLNVHRQELHDFLKAYYDGIRILYLLKPHMKEAYASKLGGGPIEGIMLTDEMSGLKLKLVDRLVFTRLNFAGEQERARQKLLRGVAREAEVRAARERDAVPDVLKSIQDGALFYVGKLQPPHAGHVALISAAIAAFGVENVVILASGKEPNLAAQHWKELSVTDKPVKRDIAARKWTHVFTPELRMEMLRYGLPPEARIHIADLSAFWGGYFRRMHEAGGREPVSVLMGQKEISSGRYKEMKRRLGDRLRVISLDMQRDGLSGTDVRQAIRSLYENGDEDSYNFLRRALDYIPRKELDRVIGRLLHEWQLVDAKAAELV